MLQIKNLISFLLFLSIFSHVQAEERCGIPDPFSSLPSRSNANDDAAEMPRSHGQAYILEKEALEDIEGAIAEVLEELKYIDEKTLEGSLELLGLQRREELIGKLQGLKGSLGQLSTRVENGDKNGIFLPGEIDILEEIITRVRLKDYEDILDDPSTILSNITNLGLGSVDSMEELKDLIVSLTDDLLEYEQKYDALAKKFASNPDEVSNAKEVLMEIISSTIRSWLKLDKLNEQVRFKRKDLPQEHKNMLRETNHKYRKFLRELYTEYIGDTIEFSIKGSMLHARLQMAMVLSTEKEEKMMELATLKTIYEKNAMPVPDHVVDFFEEFKTRNTKLLRDLKHYISFGPDYSTIKIRNLSIRE